jgi:hypothetical protein
MCSFLIVCLRMVHVCGGEFVHIKLVVMLNFINVVLLMFFVGFCMSDVDNDLIDALKECVGYSLAVSGDIGHLLDEDELGVRVFSSSVVEVVPDKSRQEVVIVMAQADLNYTVRELFSTVVNDTVDLVLDKFINEKGGMSATKRFSASLKKELMNGLAGRLKQ